MEDIQPTTSRKTARVFQPTVLFHSDGRNPGDVQQHKKPQSLVWPYMMSLQNYINFPIFQFQIAGNNTGFSNCDTSEGSSICPLGCSTCPDQSNLSSSVTDGELFKNVSSQLLPSSQASSFLSTLQSNRALETSQSSSLKENIATSIISKFKTTDSLSSNHSDQSTQNQDERNCRATTKDSNETIDKKLKSVKSNVPKKKLKCPFCSVSCSNHGQLRGHLRCHTGEKPFVCTFDGCTKQFARNEELTRHKRIHTGVRPFNCATCKKTFGRKDHLQKHLKTHLEPGEKKIFVCTVCHQGYSRSDALTRHKGTAHSEQRLHRGMDK